MHGMDVRAFLPSLEQSDGGDRLPGAAVTRAQDDRVDQARGRAQGTHSGLLLRGDG